jgi:hypothetical protein
MRADSPCKSLQGVSPDRAQLKVSSHQLDGIKAGDHVDFEFYVRGKVAVIRRIHKIG